ncbi:MAG: citrate/2-methylcitrate synthase, partial [Isosphaeraceae bacterium]
MSTAVANREQVGSLDLDGRKVGLPVLIGTENERAIDVEHLRRDTGYITLDEGYRNTGSCKSAITFIDGERGVLRYRGIPIEQIADYSSFLETTLLLIYGELPTSEQLARFEASVEAHAWLHEGMRHSFAGFPPTGHPMAILSSMINTISCYESGVLDQESDETFEDHAALLISKVRTVAAAAYKTAIGQPIMYPDSRLDYCRNFLHMMFSLPTRPYEA